MIAASCSKLMRKKVEVGRPDHMEPFDQALAEEKRKVGNKAGSFVKPNNSIINEYD